MSERFERHARTVSLLTMLSRVTGLARDASISRIFGAGGLTSAFFFAFMIPNLFRRLFGEGALAAAFLPVYTQLNRDDPQTARRLASLTVSLLVTVLGSIVLLGEIALFFISKQANHSNLAVWLLMVMLPYMPLVCLVAVLGAMLQVHGRFGPTAAAPIVLNLCLIGTAVGLHFVLERDVTAADYDRHRLIHIGCVAGSMLLAGMLQIFWSLFALRDQKWWSGELKAARDPMARVIRQALPMIVGLGVLQLNTALDGVIASYPTAIGPTIFGIDYPLREGAMAAVSFAQRLYQFPLGVFGIAVATAIFPALARLADDGPAFAATVRRGLRLVVFIGLPASAGLILVRVPLTAVILQGGDFRPEDTERVGFILLGYAPAIWSYSMAPILTRAFYARGDSKTPMRIVMGVVALNLVLNCILIWTPLKEAGLAWSTAICSVVQVVFLVSILRRRTEHIVDREVITSWTKTVALTAAMTALVGALTWLLPEPHGWGPSFTVLLVAVGAGMLAVFSLAGALKMPELWWALGRRGD
ncbi:MAG: murein biosynthesis integral membrane protein MurJ [Phycisphaerales bacterium]|nr:MAG: murein biosynthesis integral membrane protein MurJ [Phycisphaerales bacterium]